MRLGEARAPGAGGVGTEASRGSGCPGQRAAGEAMLRGPICYVLSVCGPRSVRVSKAGVFWLPRPCEVAQSAAAPGPACGPRALVGVRPQRGGRGSPAGETHVSGRRQPYGGRREVRESVGGRLTRGHAPAFSGFAGQGPRAGPPCASPAWRVPLSSSFFGPGRAAVLG